MKEFIKRARARGLSPANILCWGLQTLGRNLGSLWGLMRFRLKASLLGVNAGRKIKVRGKIILMRWPGGKINIGDNVSLVSGSHNATACSTALPFRLRVFGPGAAITIGDNSELTAVSITARSTKIEIGNNVLIAPNCIITDSDFHIHWPCESRSTNPGYENDAPVRIGDYAWIGMNCVILKGVSIGKGCIIGAGSVISRNIPDYCVACGNPAVIKSRHDETVAR